MRLCEGSLGWLGGVLDMRCALGWTGWSRTHQGGVEKYWQWLQIQTRLP
jgi:hypothetical protein